MILTLFPFDGVTARMATPPTLDGAIDRRVFRTTVIVVATLGTAYALWQLTELLLLLFACALIALILFDFAKMICTRTGIGFGGSLALATLTVVGGLVGAFAFFGASLSSEFAELAQRLPAAWEAFQLRLRESSVGTAVLARADEFTPDGRSLMGTVTTVLASVGGALSALAIVLIGGIYLAAQPRLYGRGVMLLTPEGARGKLAATFAAIATALNAWLKGQGLGMVFVGAATGIGLAIVGIPAAPAIGLIAGLCEFVPYLGTIVVGIPVVILGFAESTTTGIWALVVLILVQQVQGNLIMPLLQSRMVDLPPALTIFSLVAAGVLLGPLGVILATPLTVVAMVLVNAVYLNDADRAKSEVGRAVAEEVDGGDKAAVS